MRRSDTGKRQTIPKENLKNGHILKHWKNVSICDMCNHVNEPLELCF